MNFSFHDLWKFIDIFLKEFPGFTLRISFFRKDIKKVWVVSFLEVFFKTIFYSILQAFSVKNICFSFF